jgi:uncharacterized protein YkwD
MAIGRCLSGWASLTGLALSLGALGACSGDGGADAPAGTDSSPMGASPAPPPSTPEAAPPTGSAPGARANEGTPNVTGLDEATPPEGGDEPTGEQASQSGGLPAAAALVPDTEHCASVQDWDAEWVAFEEEVLALVNASRAQPADCGVEGQFQPAAALTMDPILRCSARLQSLDMFEREFFDHVNPDGVDPFERMSDAGFSGSYLGENIAQGQRTPEDVMADWMESDGHCANIMRPEFTSIGVGFDPGAQTRGGKSNFWTQNFGTPLSPRGNRR